MYNLSLKPSGRQILRNTILHYLLVAYQRVQILWGRAQTVWWGKRQAIPISHSNWIAVAYVTVAMATSRTAPRRLEVVVVAMETVVKDVRMTQRITGTDSPVLVKCKKFLWEEKQQ